MVLCHPSIYKEVVKMEYKVYKIDNNSKGDLILYNTTYDENGNCKTFPTYEEAEKEVIEKILPITNSHSSAKFTILAIYSK
jgi:hypothetical protein